MAPTASRAVGLVRRRPLVTIALALVVTLAVGLVIARLTHTTSSTQAPPSLGAEQVSTLSIAASCAPEGPCYGLDGSGNLGTITGGQLRISANLAEVLGGLAQGPSLTFGALSCPRRNDCIAGTNLGIVRAEEGTLTSFTPPWLLEGGVDLVSCTATALCLAASQGGPGTASTVIRSVDGGTTWTEVQMPTGVAVSDLWCSDTGRCLALGSRGAKAVSLTSTNAGLAWSSRSAVGLDPLALPQSLACATPMFCLAAGTGPPRSSSDGGLTWQVVRASDGVQGATTCTPAGTCVLLEGTSRGAATLTTTADLGATWVTRAVGGPLGTATPSPSSQPASISCTVTLRCIATTASGAFLLTAPQAAS